MRLYHLLGILPFFRFFYNIYNMNKPKYAAVNLLRTTYRLLKIEAAKRDLPLAQLLDIAVKNEIDRGKNELS